MLKKFYNLCRSYFVHPLTSGYYLSMTFVKLHFQWYSKKTFSPELPSWKHSPIPPESWSNSVIAVCKMLALDHLPAGVCTKASIDDRRRLPRYSKALGLAFAEPSSSLSLTDVLHNSPCKFQSVNCQQRTLYQ